MSNYFWGTPRDTVLTQISWLWGNFQKSFLVKGLHTALRFSKPIHPAHTLVFASLAARLH